MKICALINKYSIQRKTKIIIRIQNTGIKSFVVQRVWTVNKAFLNQNLSRPSNFVATWQIQKHPLQRVTCIVDAIYKRWLYFFHSNHRTPAPRLVHLPCSLQLIGRMEIRESITFNRSVKPTLKLVKALVVIIKSFVIFKGLTSS